jgi:hypothetical protein
MVRQIAELPSRRANVLILSSGGATVAQLSEGDTVGLTAEVTIIHGDGKVTVRLHGFDYPVTVSEHLSLIAKKKAVPGPRRSAKRILGCKTMALWSRITHYTLAFREFIAPSYCPERYYMRGPGPACARRQKGSFY